MRAIRAFGALFILAGAMLAFGLSGPAHAAASLAVTASVSPNPMIIGGDATYTVTITNSGSDDATDATTTITLDDNVTIGTLPAGCTASGQVVTCGGTGTTIDAGGSATYEIPVTVKSSLSDGTNITLRASVSSSSAQTQSTQLISQAQTLTDIEITKTASTPHINPDGTITYTLTVTNHGPSDAVNVTVQDPTDGNLTTITALPTECPASGLTVTCPLGTLTSGQVATFEFTVKVNSNVTDGTVIHNCATVYTGTRESNTDNNVSCADTTVGPVAPATADIKIKKVGPAVVTEGGIITYTFEVTNDGTADATEVLITDPVYTGTTVLSLPAGCAEVSGTVRCVVGSLAAGETKTYTATEQLDPSVHAGDTIVNCASTASLRARGATSSCVTTDVEASSTPSPAPSESVSPSRSPAPVPSPTPETTTPGIPGVPRHSPTLPTTGADIAPWTVTGAGLVMAGLVLCWVSRPRRHRT
jgi:uncharacterized repeat protein (TIGR01451 family)